MSEPRIVTMKIVHGYPPLFDRMLEVFPNAKKPGVLFCWGDTIYNPSNVTIPGYLVAHESVHRDQQGKEPAFWWERYMANPEFRLAQEVPAHREEYRQYSIDFPNRNMRRLALKTIAQRLSGPLYGNMISFDKARALIKEKADD